jgi:type IV secretory pathway VirB10-like protein
MGSSPYDMGGDPGGGPDGLHLRTAPRTTRLNRNALIALVLVGAFVLVAAAVTLVQNRTAIAPAGDASMATATSNDRFWQDRSDGVAAYQPEARLPDVSAPPLPEPNVVPVAVPPGDSGATSRQQRILRAMDSSPKVSAFQTARVNYGATTAPGAVPGSRGGAPANETGAVADALRDALAPKDPTELQNNQAGKKAFLAGAKLAEEDETNPYLVREAISAFEVTAGMILPAVLITQGDSDLPGLMTGRVRENVYDSATGKHLLVPQGTTIVGIYDSVVSFGQRRLLVAWQRLIYPDGTKLNIGGMPGTDLIGAAGFHDQIDRHYKRVFGSALLLSVITAGVTLSQDDTTNGGLGDDQSSRQQIKNTLATALGQNLGDVASEMIRREMNVQPTLKIRPGYRFNVFVNKDLIFEGPYLNTYVGGGLIP